jgi:predicted MFS family arabinose efflux permease
MRSYLNTLRLLSPDGHRLVLAQSLGFAGYVGIYVVLFNLYLSRLGYGTEFIGLANGIAIFCHAFLCLPAGALGRQWGVRRAVMMGTGVAGLGLALLPLAELMTGDVRSIWIIVTYTLAWGGAAFYLVNNVPFLIAVTDIRARNHIFSMAAAMGAIAAFAGSLAGGLLPGLFAPWLSLSLDLPDAYRYSLLVGAAVWLLMLLPLQRTAIVQPEETTATGTSASKAPYLLIVIMVLFTLLRVSADGTGRNFFNVYLDAGLQVPTATIGMIMAFGQLLAVPAALVMPLLAARWGRERTIALFTFGLALCLVPMASIPNWGAAAFSYMTLVALVAVIAPLSTVFSQEAVHPSWRSTMSGAFMMANGLGLAWTAIGGGYIIASAGYATLYWLGALLAALSAMLFTGYFFVTTRRARRLALT